MSLQEKFPCVLKKKAQVPVRCLGAAGRAPQTPVLTGPEPSADPGLPCEPSVSCPLSSQPPIFN